MSSFEQEFKALPNTCVFYEKWDLGIFEITGKDRIKLLHNIASNDFEHLKAGSGTRSSFLTNIGRIVSIGNFMHGENNLWVEIPRELHASTAQHLDKYIIMEDVQVSSLLEKWKIYEILGDSVIEKLSSLLPELAQLTENYQFKKIERHGTPVLIWRYDHFNTKGFCLAIEASVEEKILPHLAKLGLLQISPETVMALEIYHGEPRLGADYTLDNLPLEIGEKKSISFTKGCYTGQEIIARIDSRGHVAKGLAQIRWDSSVAINPGQEILDPETKTTAGIVTRSIADEKNTYSLGFLKYDFLKKDQALITVDGGKTISGKILKTL